ncbi:MAG: NUDIX hydrolase [Desulfotomaculum sp. BICA1-6]|nr:MAG: NUDIX hydrolase [Peptococcaceae bacterium BRH_c8a]KJS78762.1 MAG: NUDIX hydrolase [Desulfotomaculum sp. BICA1-6]
MVNNMKKIVNKLAVGTPNIMGQENLLVSAVLLPLVVVDGVTEILFEVRSMLLHRQPGEICFPGGRVERHELDNPAAAAVRETAEELGLQCNDIELLAPMDLMITPMGTVTYPYVGYILSPERIKPNREEVESTFTVPLSFLTAYQPQTSIVDVATRYNRDFPLHRVPESYRGGWQKRWSFPTYIYEYEDYFIWGMTAIILHHFLDMLQS